LAAVAAPTFVRSLRYHQIESAARRVKMDIEQFRHVARMKSRSVSIQFDGMEYSEDPGETLPPDVDHLDRPGAEYSVDLSKAPFELESVTLTIDDEDAERLSFDGYGHPIDADGNRFESCTIKLKQGDNERVVTLDPDTGQVTISNE
jgi:hypothetical protein